MEEVSVRPCKVLKDSRIGKSVLTFEKTPLDFLDKDLFYNQPTFTVNKYHENDEKIRSRVESYLSKISDFMPRKKLFGGIRNRLKEYRYCVQTDIHRTSYMFSLDLCLELIKKYVEDEEISQYLQSFFTRIAEIEKERYMYLSDFSLRLITLFVIKMMPPDFTFSVFVDDVIFFGNDMKKLESQINAFGKILQGHNLVLNNFKTVYTDTVKESLIMLHTVIHTPRHVLDIKLMDYLDDQVMEEDEITLFKSSLDISQYVLKKQKEYGVYNINIGIIESDSLIYRLFTKTIRSLILSNTYTYKPNTFVCYNLVENLIKGSEAPYYRCWIKKD